MHPVTSKILKQLHDLRSSIPGISRISGKPLGYSWNTHAFVVGSEKKASPNGLCFYRALALTTSFCCSVDQIWSKIFSWDLTSNGSLVQVATSCPAFTFVSSGRSSTKIISAESALAKCIIGTVTFLTSMTSPSSLATLALVWFTWNDPEQSFAFESSYCSVCFGPRYFA